MPLDMTENSEGEKTAMVQTGSNKKQRNTVMLLIMVDSKKFLLYRFITNLGENSKIQKSEHTYTRCEKNGKHEREGCVEYQQTKKMQRGQIPWKSPRNRPRKYHQMV
jgi:hypothetical protein